MKFSPQGALINFQYGGSISVFGVRNLKLIQYLGPVNYNMDKNSIFGVHKSEGRTVRFGVIHYNDPSNCQELINCKLSWNWWLNPRKHFRCPKKIAIFGVSQTLNSIFGVPKLLDSIFRGLKRNSGMDPPCWKFVSSPFEVFPRTSTLCVHAESPKKLRGNSQSPFCIKWLQQITKHKQRLR